MAFLNSKIRKDVADVFSALEKTVGFKYFGQEVECRFCKETRDLLEELASLSDKIKLEIYDFQKNKDVVDALQIARVPALAVIGEKDFGIRFYGIPSGYEFTSLIEAVKLVGSGQVSLSPETKLFLDKLEKDVLLQVFVTPTCPYCPGSVIMAHQMAYYSPRVKGEMIEATEFPQLAQKNNVLGVPRTVINEKEFVEGAALETMVVEKIKAALAG